MHDYLSEQEFRAHADRKTDHVGNLQSDGTWVRFSPSSLNVLGEAHEDTTLADVVQAVHTRSFIYELFPADDLSLYPATLSTIREMNADRIASLGIGSQDNLGNFGAESLFPKLGQSYAQVLPRLARNRMFALHNYFGEIAQNYLKVGWAYAAGVHREIQRRRQGPMTRAAGKLSARRRAESRVAETYARSRFAGQFIPHLQPGESLGQSLEMWEQQAPGTLDALFGELRKFTQDMITLMREKVSDNPGMNIAYRAAIGWKGLRGGDQDRFQHWRNLEFRQKVLQAQQRGIRYAGMGSNHSDYLRGALRRIDGLNFYDLDGEDLRRDRQLTFIRANEMNPNRNQRREDDFDEVEFAPM